MNSTLDTTMTVFLEDGTEVQRPFALRRSPRGEVAGPPSEPIKVPTAYPGEEAVEQGGRWVMKRKDRP